MLIYENENKLYLQVLGSDVTKSKISRLIIIL